MKYITLVCEKCGKKFDRQLKEYKRCKQKGFAIACNRSCGTALRNKKHSKGNPDNLLRGHPLDDLSPFRFIFGQIKNKSKKRGKDFSLTLVDLKEQWDKQKGVCPYTGYSLKFPCLSTHYVKRESNPYFASLDRIDSSKGYSKDNIEFVCVAVNYAKNGFTRSQMLEFFKQIHV